MSILNSLHVFESKNNDNNYKEDDETNFIRGGYVIAKSLQVENAEKQIISGGYNVNELLNVDGKQMGGGGTDIFKDLQIPLGLYCDNVIVKDFYKSVKSKVIDDDLFDTLFDMVSKTKNKSTRREKVKINKVTKKIR